MLRLILNIANYSRSIRLAHAEGSVATLPGESAPVGPSLFQPSRRVGLDNAQAVCNRKFRWKSCEKMDMIRCSANRDRFGAHFSKDASDVGMNVRSNGVGEKWPAFRCGKDHMHEQVSKCVRHSYAPSEGLRLNSGI